MKTNRSLTKRLALLATLSVMLLLLNTLPAPGGSQGLGPRVAYAAPATWDISAGDLVISSGGEYIVTGSTLSHAISVNTADAVTITLDHVSIDVSAVSDKSAFDSGGNVTLYLIGSNTLRSGANQPGIDVTDGEQLTVSNAPSLEGALTVYGGSAGAGIGGGKTENGGAVTINSGAVTATGGVTGAGIGGGSGGTGGRVSINGGVVTAMSSGWGAGIGGGYLKDGGAVTIGGGVVRVVGGDYSAGIGGAYAGNGGPVTITGGTVTVNGGVFGAGIGGGYGRDGGDVVITGGSIKAYGGSDGSNIGAGNLGANNGTLTNGYAVVALQTIPQAVAAVDPMVVTYAIPVSGSNPAYSYVYTYTGAGHGGGDTNLYFYLPPGELPAPTELKATTVSSSRVDLSWVDNASSEQGFRVERCAGPGCSIFAQIATVGANVTSYSNTGLASATSYSYRVRAYNASGDSSYSGTASATTAAAPTVPGAPSNLAASALPGTQITLTWTDNALNETGFRIERCQGSTCTKFAQIAAVGANVTSYTNTGLSKNTAYRYRVRVYNAAGTSAYSNIAAATAKR